VYTRARGTGKTNNSKQKVRIKKGKIGEAIPRGLKIPLALGI
jgi:hypothetical protein